MTATQNPFEVARPNRSRVIWIALGTLAALLVATLAYALATREPQCAAGIPRVKVPDQTREECIGITDSYPFEPRFRQVIAALGRENAFAAAGGQGTYVTVAFLGALTNPDERVVHQLEGAITGQHRVNREPLVGGRPRIKMVLANMDSAEQHWQEIVHDLIGMIDGPDHLVAVTGLGLSLNETLWAAQRLDGATLPMVADIVTTDAIDKKDADGFARVNPRVGDEVAALAQYLGAKTKLRTAMLVYSSRKSDLYTSSLVAAFKKNAMGGYWRAGGSVENPFGRDPGTEFNIIVGSLCSAHPPEMIFYAGRGADLPAFIGYLSNRSCYRGRVTVVTGSDAVRLTLDNAENKLVAQALTAQRNPISLIYVPLAEPSVLDDHATNPEDDQYNKFQAVFRQLGFDPAHLRTGWAIMSHDAVLTAAKAIKQATPQGGLPAPDKVRDLLYLVSGSANSVPGASGRIQIDPATGNRSGLRLPVLRMRPGGEPELLDLHQPLVR